jgi:methylaspartate ammonia-lyase
VEIASKNLTIPIEMHVSLGGGALHINTYAGLGDADGTLTLIDMKHLVSEMVEGWLYYDDVEAALRELTVLHEIIDAKLSKLKTSASASASSRARKAKPRSRKASRRGATAQPSR